MTRRLMVAGTNANVEDILEQPLTRLEAVRTFLPDSTLEKLAAVSNQALLLHKKRATTANEILGLILLHVLCASYDESLQNQITSCR